MKYAPVAVFGYNRPEHLKKTINALAENDGARNTKLFLFLDGAKGEKDKILVEEVHEIGKNLIKDKRFAEVTVLISENNKGLASSIIQGINSVINDYGRVIALEDDLVTSRDFLAFMNACLDYYESNEKVWSVSGYTFSLPSLNKIKEDVYFCNRASSWGWATWKNRWETVDWEVIDYGKFRYNLVKRKRFNQGGTDLANMLDRQMAGDIDSWAIRWCYSQFKQGKLTVFPCKSKVLNIGQDGSGTHSNNKNQYDSDGFGENQYKLIPPKIERQLLKEFKEKPSLKLRNRIKGYIFYNVIRR